MSNAYHPNGKLRTVEYYDNENLLHRDNAPAVLLYDKNGTLMQEGWRQHGQAHRIGGSADRYWDSDGKLVSEWYWENGQLIRVVDY